MKRIPRFRKEPAALVSKNSNSVLDSLAREIYKGRIAWGCRRAAGTASGCFCSTAEGRWPCRSQCVVCVRRSWGITFVGYPLPDNRSAGDSPTTPTNPWGTKLGFVRGRITSLRSLKVKIIICDHFKHGGSQLLWNFISSIRLKIEKYPTFLFNASTLLQSQMDRARKSTEI